ncbi:MAG: hypothetical protein RJA70_985 [Pseudomonadota bacterium]|jgi:hypothetical protein
MPVDVGQPPWTREELVAALPAFEDVYARRPIRDNQGGMKAPHMFATWFIARHLAPELIIESGVFRGQSTWLLEQACPAARIVAIDPNLTVREYVSPRVSYHTTDFSALDWSGLRGRPVLAFFDDHQNAYTRLQQCAWFGLRDVIFEDNYPAGRGDCYSLKKALAGAGFQPAGAKSPRRAKLASRLAKVVAGSGSGMPAFQRNQVAPNLHDAAMLRDNLEIYHELPPVFAPERTRWGGPWDHAELDPAAPLLDAAERERHPVLWEEAEHYTYICYARLAR